VFSRVFTCSAIGFLQPGVLFLMFMLIHHWSLCCKIWGYVSFTPRFSPLYLFDVVLQFDLLVCFEESHASLRGRVDTFSLI